MYRPRQDTRPQMSKSHRIRQPSGSREDFTRHGETGSPIAETRFRTRRTRFPPSVQEMASRSSRGDKEAVAPGHSESPSCRDYSSGRAVEDSREANHPCPYPCCTTSGNINAKRTGHIFHDGFRYSRIVFCNHCFDSNPRRIKRNRNKRPKRRSRSTQTAYEP